jgi:hypothetical protein
MILPEQASIVIMVLWSRPDFWGFFCTFPGYYGFCCGVLVGQVQVHAVFFIIMHFV